MATTEILKVRRFLTRKGMNKIILAKAAGISRRSLDKVGSDNWRPSHDVMKKLLAGISRLERLIGTADE